MADLFISSSTGEVALASVAHTLFLVATPANQRVKVKGLEVFGRGMSNTDTPAKIELMTCTSQSGGTTGTVVTAKVDGDMGETIQSLITGNYSAEPTLNGLVVQRVYEVHPQTGLVIYFPMHDEIKVKGGQFFILRATQAQGDTFSVQLLIEE